MTKVKKIMLANVPVLTKKAKISEAITLIGSKPHGCVIIVESKKPIGIITELDIVREIVAKGSSVNKSLDTIMSSPVTTMLLDTTIEEANKIIDTKKYRKYPVVDRGNLVGLVTENDIVNSIGYNIRFHRNLQNLVLILFVLFEFFVVGYKILFNLFAGIP
ncbi:MAG: CBS domain-containing protein [Campylobacterota bacterium]